MLGMNSALQIMEGTRDTGAIAFFALSARPYQSPSEARGLRYLKNTFVTRMITWAQKCEMRSRRGLSTAVCPSVCYLLN